MVTELVTKHISILADAQQKWLVFSSPELLDDADVPVLSAFMDACFSYIPTHTKQLLERSFNELNIIDEDTGTVQ